MVPALLDHLWQSTVFAAAIGLLTLAMRDNGAHVRYGLWLAASVKFLIPFALLAHLGGLLAPALPAAAVTDLGPMVESVQPLAEPFSGAAPLVAIDAASDMRAPLILFGLWALGFAAILVLRLTQWVRVERALWAAAPLSMAAAAVPVKSTPLFLEPGLIGIRNPALLLPADIATRLTPAELNAVLAHEHCHLQRRDNLTAALHMLVEALFWFYPLVWWIGRKLIEECERACDENVLAAGNDAEIYAESILKVCRSYVQSPIAAVSGVSGADLKKRIEAIMSGRVVRSLNTAKRLFLTATAIATLSMPLAAGLLTPFESGAMQTVAANAPANTPRVLSPDIAALIHAPSSNADIAARRAEQALPRTAVPFEPEKFDKYVGYYMVKPDVILTIMRRNNRYFARFPAAPRPSFTLKATLSFLPPSSRRKLALLWMRKDASPA